MIALRYCLFLFGALLYPVRFALFCTNAFLVFFTKPGAAFLFPALTTAVLWSICTYWGGPLEQWVRLGGTSLQELLGPELGPQAFAWRMSIASAAAFLVLYWGHSMLATLLQPLVHALPAPRRPLRPMLPLRIPKHVIRTVPVRVSVKSPGTARYRGDIADIGKHLPVDMQAILARKEEASPVFRAEEEMPVPAARRAAQEVPISRPANEPEPSKDIPSTQVSPRTAKVPGRRQPTTDTARERI